MTKFLELPKLPLTPEFLDKIKKDFKIIEINNLHIIAERKLAD